MDPNPLWIGADYNQNTFNGAIDEFSLFGSALTQAQVTQLYLSSVGSLPSASPVQISAGAVLDLNGTPQTVASLSDNGPGAGAP